MLLAPTTAAKKGLTVEEARYSVMSVAFHAAYSSVRAWYPSAVAASVLSVVSSGSMELAAASVAIWASSA